MAFSYTEQQQSAIEVRNRNVLVSAAAGSGKTAVLVERVIQMILNREISIDELLVVTFTRAAAAEMRERISDALSQALHRLYRPELREQLVLLPAADITTIHAFCLKVIRENYSLLGLGPDFRIADETEIELLAEEAMAELLEAEYQRAEPEFLHLVRSFMTGTSDQPVEDAIRRIDAAAQGMAKPEEWLDLAVAGLAADSPEELEQSFFWPVLWQEIAEKLKWAVREQQFLAELAADPETEVFAEQAAYFGELLARAEALAENHDYDGLGRLLKEYAAPAMPRARKGIEAETLAEMKQRIENLRSVFVDLQSYLQNTWAENWEITQRMQRLVKELCRLTLAYEALLRDKKQKKQIIDFNDIEHMALRLLRAEDGGRTEIAERYCGKYKEVIIDEYQDTSEVQDALLELAGGEPERPNRFMVGDIKQSIYKFRQAKPEIFQQKYLSYGGLDTSYAKIDMQTNFRSRQEVLKLVNYIFRSIMTRQAAGIDYDDRAKFIFPQAAELEESYRPQLILIEKESYQSEEESAVREELEAEAAAQEIAALLSSGKMIYDKKRGDWRKIEAEDIAVLMRSPGNALPIYIETFLRWGIPVLAEEGKAYFMTSEIRTLTDFLKTLDNPRDDLALLGVLCSAIFEFEPEDLARVRAAAEAEEFLFDALSRYREDFSRCGEWSAEVWAERAVLFSEETLAKADYFLTEFRVLKDEAYLLTLGQLFDRLLERTGYAALLAGMPNGKQRGLNVQAFQEQLALWEKQEGGGLIRFLQRLGKIKSLNLSFGQPVMETGKAVRIMSIHKSKGLEFPVVLLTQLGKGFNFRDVSSLVVLREAGGILVSDIDYQSRVVREGFQKPLLKMLLRREILEEEQRLLYVALTRAREYLYLIGTVSSAEKVLQRWQEKNVTAGGYQIDGFAGDFCSREYLLAARSYLDFLMPAALRAEEYGLLALRWLKREEAESERVEAEEAAGGDLADRLESVAAKSGTKSEASAEKSGMESEVPVMKNGVESGVSAAKNGMESGASAEKNGTESEVPAVKTLAERLREAEQMPAAAIPFYPEYPYPEFIKEKITTSASEQKGAFVPEGEAVTFSGGSQGAQRGTAYHRVLALLPFSLEAERLPEFLRELAAKGLLADVERDFIEVKVLENVLRSDLWQRMRTAAERGRLKREQPFILGQPLISGDVTEQRMLQGVIDVFFEENGELVLVDYKTDRLGGDDGEFKRVLRERYAGQMEVYKRALESSTGLPVREVWLYGISRDMTVLM